MAERTRANRDTLQAHPPRTRTRKTYLLEMMSQTESSLVSLVISSPSTRGEETIHQAPKWVRDSRKAFVGSSPLGKLPTSSTVCACAARVGRQSRAQKRGRARGRKEGGAGGKCRNNELTIRVRPAPRARDGRKALIAEVWDRALQLRNDGSKIGDDVTACAKQVEGARRVCVLGIVSPIARFCRSGPPDTLVGVLNQHSPARGIDRSDTLNEPLAGAIAAVIKLHAVKPGICQLLHVGGVDALLPCCVISVGELVAADAVYLVPAHEHLLSLTVLDEGTQVRKLRRVHQRRAVVSMKRAVLPRLTGLPAVIDAYMLVPQVCERRGCPVDFARARADGINGFLDHLGGDIAVVAIPAAPALATCRWLYMRAHFWERISECRAQRIGLTIGGVNARPLSRALAAELLRIAHASTALL
jgi:hypothetical protein